MSALPADAPRILTADEVADLLRVNTATVRRMAKQRTLTPYRVGRLLRFDARDIDDYLARQKDTPA